MSLLFIGLSIPVLIFILIYNYNKNSAGMVAILNDAVAQTSQAGIERTESLIEGTESPLRFLAEVAGADVAYFPSDAENIELPLAESEAGTSSCITSQCSATLPPSILNISTAITGFGAHPT